MQLSGRPISETGSQGSRLIETNLILILDDDPTVQELLGEVLHTEGYFSRAFSSGVEALKYIEQEQPVAALVDLQLEDIHGLEIIREIRKRSLDVACIILTGHGSRETAVQALNLGAYSYLEKPAQISEILLTLRAATERVRGQRALRKSEARFRTVAQLAADGILILDASGSIVFCNVAARDMFGYMEGELCKKPISQLIPDVPSVANDAAVESQSSDEKAGRIKILATVGRTKQGVEFPVELSIAATNVAGEKLWSMIIRDVTEKRMAEEEARRQARLVAIGELAAGIAHDFNNALGPIVLYGELLQAEPGLSEEGRERLEVIAKQADMAAALVIQILDFSRRSLMKLQAVDLLSFLDEMRALLERTLPENITLRLDHEGSDFYVLADVARIQQVVLNLALNARDAMPDGGELKLSLSKLSPGSEGGAPRGDLVGKGWIRLRVTDTGTGIPSAILDRIFDPFFTTKDPGKGTGLGLAQCYGIVKQHGGEIDVETQLGAGTTFIIDLPETEEAEETEIRRQIEAEPIGGESETILIVEDDLSVRRALADVLQQNGYEVLLASSGVEAMGVFSQHRDEVDLVLCDMVLTDTDGRRVLREITRIRPGIEGVLLTGYPLGENTKELTTRAGFVWSQKPIQSNSLLRMIRGALDANERRDRARV
jgi:two-component system cell cycle sensor histidine kinase/response regulator CckA